MVIAKLSLFVNEMEVKFSRQAVININNEKLNGKYRLAKHKFNSYLICFEFHPSDMELKRSCVDISRHLDGSTSIRVVQSNGSYDV